MDTTLTAPVVVYCPELGGPLSGPTCCTDSWQPALERLPNSRGRRTASVDTDHTDGQTGGESEERARREHGESMERAWREHGASIVQWTVFCLILKTTAARDDRVPM